MDSTVTIYELKENEELTRVPEASSEWAAMVDDLGLKGQKKLLTVPKENVAASPIPYLWMNAKTFHSFKTLCPMKQDIEAYDKMPVPVLILGHVKQCQMKGWFKQIEVWYDDEKPDPVVVGLTDIKAEERNTYLIGRWAAEDRSLEALAAMAFEKRKAQLTTKLREKIAECEAALVAIDSSVATLLSGDYTPLNYL